MRLHPAKPPTLAPRSCPLGWRKSFPEGEVRQREIMDLGLTRTLQVLPGTAEIGAEVTGARTMAGDLESVIAARAIATNASLTEPGPSEDAATGVPAKPKSNWVRNTALLAVLLVAAAVAAVWGFQAPAPEASSTAVALPSPVEPAVPVAALTSADPISSDGQPLEGVKPEAGSEKSEVAATEKTEPAKPRMVESEVAKPTASKRRPVARKPRPRKKVRQSQLKQNPPPLDSPVT